MFSIVCLLSACAATSRQFLPIPTSVDNSVKSEIIVMRKYSAVGLVNGVDVWDGENLIASVGPGGYVHWEREPGRATVRVRKAGVTMIRVSELLEIEAQPGDVYYVLAETVPFGGYKLKLLEGAKGKTTLKEYSAPKYVKRK